MTRRNHRVGTARVVLVILALAGAVAAATVLHTHAPADAGPRTVPVADVPSAAAPALVRECGSQTAVQPVSMPLWCLAPQQHLDDLSWTAWGRATATATGDLRDTSCFCAGDATQKYPVTVSLGRATQNAGADPYTRLTISFPGRRPAWAYQASYTFQWTTDGYISKETT